MKHVQMQYGQAKLMIKKTIIHGIINIYTLIFSPPPKLIDC